MAIDCARETLSRYVNHDDKYKAIAAELVGQLKAQGLPVAWRQLVKQCGAGSLNACIEILNRTEGAVPEELHVHEHTTPEQVALAVARESHDDDNNSATETD